MQQLITAGLVVIRDRKLLLAFSKNKNAWYLPGGKADNNETTSMALIREIKEELNMIIDPKKLDYYTHISAPAFGEYPEIIMEQDCFLYPLDSTPRPGAEIKDIKYFNGNSYSLETQVPGVILLMKKLQEDDLID